jgi:Fe-S-cluster containining protein
MSCPGPLPPTPKGSTLEGVIAAVGAIYARIERDQRSFLAAATEHGAPLACIPGCGACCEPFVPDLLPAEAAYAAAWILARAPALVPEIAAWRRCDRSAAPPCPFLKKSEVVSRCAIYPARFLICRLFGASGIRDREGRTAFRPCAHMPFAGYRSLGEERPALTGDALLRAFGAEPPIMTDYATELVALSPSESGERHSVLEALPPALIRVGLSLSLAARALDRTYSNYDERED